MKRVWTYVVVALSLVPLESGAAAASDVVPRVTLRAGDDEQRGRLWFSTEASSDGQACATGQEPGAPTPQKHGLELERAPFRGQLVIEREDEPRLRLRAYTELKEAGYVDFGSRQPVRWDVEAAPDSWIVTFRTAAHDHVYLDLRASWTEGPDCADHGSYVFHLERA